MKVKVEMEININEDVTKEQVEEILKSLSIMGVSASIIK